MRGLQLAQLVHHQSYVSCCAFSSDGRLLVTGSNDKTVALWSLHYAQGAPDKRSV